MSKINEWDVTVVDSKDYEKVFLEFNKYINSDEVDRELKSMGTTQWYMIDRIRKKWNDIKRGK